MHGTADLAEPAELNNITFFFKYKHCYFENLYYALLCSMSPVYLFVNMSFLGVLIVNIYDMVWRPFVLGVCVPCAGSRLKNPLSFFCLTIVSSESLAKGMGTKYLFCLPGLYLTAYFAKVLPPSFNGECLCYIVWSILID